MTTTTIRPTLHLPALPCRTCGEPATYLHFVPTPSPQAHIEEACDECDPSYYAIRLTDLETRPDFWLQHLRRSKRLGVAEMLMAWIVAHAGSDTGLEVLWDGRP